MAKQIKLRKHDTGRIITTKTPYGSDSSMLINDPTILKQVNLSEGFVLCKDDDGYYVTKSSHIDNNTADPYRNCSNTRAKFDPNIEIKENTNVSA